MANQRTRTPSFASDRFAARQASPRPLSASSGGVGRTSELLIRQSGRARSASLRPLASLLIRLRESDFLTSLLVRSFRALQRLGVNVTPNHFYWPIPDVAGLEHRDWQPARMTTDLHLEKQLFLLEKITAEYGSEWSFPESAENHCGEYHYNNGLFETVDAEIAYSLVRQYKPPRIIEIGSGFSTRLLARALEANRGEGSGGELITIDPSPGKRLPAHRWLNQVTVIPQPVEDLDLELFRNLAPNDVLFIDSSHVVKTGSDVVREYLEILPALPPGVLVHVHDIFLPWDYPRDLVVKNLCFWSEQYLLQAFLSFNSSFEVIWASSAMQASYPRALEAAFPYWKDSYRRLPKFERRFVPTLDGRRVWPSSFWMVRV